MSTLKEKLLSPQLWVTLVGMILPIGIQQQTAELGWDKALICSGVVGVVYVLFQGWKDGRARAKGAKKGSKLVSRKAWLTVVGAMLPIVAQFLTGEIGWSQVALQTTFVVLAYLGGEELLGNGQSNLHKSVRILADASGYKGVDPKKEKP